MEYTVTSHPKASVVEDNIFSYLVVEYPRGTVDVFRTERGGVYFLHKCFFDFAHFEQRMPETAKAIVKDRINNGTN